MLRALSSQTIGDYDNGLPYFKAKKDRGRDFQAKGALSLQRPVSVQWLFIADLVIRLGCVSEMAADDWSSEMCIVKSHCVEE